MGSSKASGGGSKGPSPQDVRYPNVFDNHSRAKLAAGFIQGVKMALPTGFERTDNKKYEEVLKSILKQRV